MTREEVEHGQGWHDARREFEAGELDITLAIESFKFDPPDSPFQKGFLDYVRFMKQHKSGASVYPVFDQ